MRFELRLQVTQGTFELDVDVDVSATSLAVFGPSGAGKTTMVEAIAGLRRLHDGRIILDGVDLTSLPPRSRCLGYVPQDDTLFPHLSVRSNVEYGARARGNRDAAALAGQMASTLAIDHLLRRRVRGLSGGERRRVALARALLSEPRALLLDEPLAGLDAAARDDVIALLRVLRETLALPTVLVSHDRDEIASFCDHVIVVDRGRVTATGLPDEVL